MDDKKLSYMEIFIFKRKAKRFIMKQVSNLEEIKR